MKKKHNISRKLLLWPIYTLGHLSMSTLMTLLGTSLFVSPAYLIGVLKASLKIEQLQLDALQSMMWLWVLGACVWAMIFITYKLFSARREQATYKSLKPARGTIIVETLIVLPVYFLLSFGLAQLSINLIHGTMGNVAGYMASRAYWVWEGEVGQNRSGTSVDAAMALEKAHVAGAMVMAAVAPSDFIGSGGNSLSSEAKAARKMTGIGGIDTHLVNLALVALDGGLSPGNTSFYKSFGAQSFAVRGATKFTHAYQVSTVAAETGGVKFEYNVLQSMPVVGRVFGTQVTDGSLAGVRGFYWTKLTRVYKFAPQKFGPNSEMPDSTFEGTAPKEEGSPKGGIKGASGWN